MDLRKSLADARIIRVAIVDDDLSDRISSANLRQVDATLEDLLLDANDPDRQAYIATLHKLGYNPANLANLDLAEPLSKQAVRDAAPKRLRKAAERILETRRGNAEPVERVKKLLISFGIKKANIDVYDGIELPQEKHYDLIIVDYYLVNDSPDRTVPFIINLVSRHSGQSRPLQLIIMSYHVEGLKRDFRNLRPETQVSSSRMRIIAKPQSEAELAGWKLTLEQLSTDRSHVPAIESFVKEAIGAMEHAVKVQSSNLWGLDLQAMKLLHETAMGDNDDFSRYVEECLSRYLLSQLEEYQKVRHALEQLHAQFQKNGSPTFISSGAEIGDSRAAVRDVMTSMVWRGEEAPNILNWPRSKAKRPGWVQSVLRFGMVLRDPHGRLWLNLTQSCDLAQAKDDLPHLSLLFIAGATNTPGTSTQSNAVVPMSAPMPGAGTELICWQLRRVYTPSVADFGDAYGSGWLIVGELRLDQALNVVANYGAQATRVALQKSVRSWAMNGIAMTVGNLRDAKAEASVTGVKVTAQMILGEKDKYELHFELSAYSALQEKFPAVIGDAALRICLGVPIKPGKPSHGDPYLHHCQSSPATMADLQGMIGNNQWLEKAENRDKIIVAVWAA